METKLPPKSTLSLTLKRNFSGLFLIDVTAEDPIDVLILNEKQYEILKKTGELVVDDSVQMESKTKHFQKEIIILEDSRYVVLGNESDKEVNLIAEIKERSYYPLGGGPTGVSGIGTSSF